MHIHYGGHLANYQPQHQPWGEFYIPSPMLLEQVIDRLGIPRVEVGMAVVNGRPVDPSVHYVSNPDVVQFFPRQT